MPAVNKASSAPAEIGSSGGIEWLYIHPKTNIVKFTTTAKAGWSSPSRPQSSSGLLPWTSPTERTIAAGQLEIYRVPGSVSFLRSGNVLHTIMPRSQCWCVDGISKFALRVLPEPPTYYRIELPGETEEDLEEVERLKLTLREVCFYERTACPFVRNFDVDLPDEPEVKKGKRRKSTGPAKKWKLDRVWRPEGWTEPEKVSEDSASGSGSTASSDDDSDSAPMPAEVDEAADEVKEITPATPMRQRALAALRSASAPQTPVILSTPPSRLRTRVDVDGTVEVSEPVVSEANDGERTRLRTFQAIPTDMPPSPPDSSAGPEYTDDRARNESDPTDDQLQPVLSTVIDSVRHQLRHESESDSERIQSHKDLAQREGTPSETGSAEENLATKVRTIQIENTGDKGTSPDDREARQSDDQHERDASTDSTTTGAERFADVDSLPQQTTVEEQTDDSLNTVQSTASLSEAVEESLTEAPHSPEAPTATETSEEPHSKPFNSERLGTPETQTTVEEHYVTEMSEEPQRAPNDDDDRPRTPENQPPIEDPYAAIQARILARRSIGGTTFFYPGHNSPTRQSTSSTSSTATISSSKSALSRRSQSSQRQHVFASAMVKKAYDTFLGPPAHLVAVMLQIASRFANGAFGVEGLLHVPSPRDTPRKLPGSYQLSGGSMEEFEEDSEEEDDFGVPLRSPVRLSSRSESSGSLRERRGWDVD